MDGAIEGFLGQSGLNFNKGFGLEGVFRQRIS